MLLGICDLTWCSDFIVSSPLLFAFYLANDRGAHTGVGSYMQCVMVCIRRTHYHNNIRIRTYCVLRLSSMRKLVK